MYMVYWTGSNDTNDAQTPRAQAFDSSDLRAALAFMEQLRARQRGGESIRFITMSSENPNAVGPSGVADPVADYNWKKRRR